MTTYKVGQSILTTSSTLLGSQGVGINSKAILSNACDVLTRAVGKNLGIQARPLFRQSSQRGIVTDTTFNALNKNKEIQEKITINEPSPYQKPSHCELHVNNIIRENVRRSSATRPPIKSESTPLVSTLGALWEKFHHLFKGDFSECGFREASDLASLYKTSGAFSLRGPGLGEGYRDHTIATFAVIDNVQTKNGLKTVVCALDCNDLGTDPETTAAQELAEQLGKMHISELTHDEANQVGAEKRRIRFIDADALVNHANKFYLHNVLSDKPVQRPGITYPKNADHTRLSPATETELRALLEQIYDTEVEKFEDVDYSKLKQPNRDVEIHEQRKYTEP